MRIRSVLVFATVLLAAAVGLAMATTGAPGGQSAAGQSVTQDRQGPPPGPPPDGMRRGGPGRGGPGGPGGPGGIGREIFRLNLTAAQQEQVKALMDAQREATESYHTTLRDIDRQIDDAITSGEFTEDAIRALAEKEAATTVELRVQRAKTDAQIYELLTAEQKKALADAKNQQAPPRRGR